MIIPRLPNPRRSSFLAVAVVAVLVVVLVVEFLPERRDLTETEPWQELTSDLELRSELMGNDPVKRDRAKEAFEVRAIQGNIFAQVMLDTYWTTSDEIERYERAVQWSLIVMSCATGADFTQPGAMSRDAALMSVSGLTVWATREQIQTGIEMAREWFAKNRTDRQLDFCNVEDIDLYEDSIQDFLN